MEYLFIALFLLGTYHFLWEGILAPSIRYSLRIELFKCRDELRRLMIENKNIPKWTFNHMQQLINTAIERMHRLDLLTLHDSQKELENNPNLKKKVYETAAKLDKEIQESNSNELVALRSRVYMLFAVAFGVNCGGWVIYIVPIFIAIATFNKIKSAIKAFLFLPVWAADKVSPSQDIRYST